ncbi:DUF846 domain containing protein [Pyrenophora tritici-repentis]|nr:DUF846 domain containing protein [Pyrenophora tritici-repentis]
MEPAQTAPTAPAPGSLSWRLSSHPITLLTFLFFRICMCYLASPAPAPAPQFPIHIHSPNYQATTNTPLPASLIVYLLGLRLLTSNFVLIFIITILLLAMDFYYLKNIAGRRLVGLRWWNEVDANTGDGRWVFESLDPETGRQINATDKRFFWLALYAQPVLWVVLAVVALISLEFIWLTLVVIALVLTITNTLAFSRCDKFSQATGFASNAMYGSGLASSLASNMLSGIFNRR